MKYETVVIGGGLAGAICASVVAKAGARTLLLEREEAVGGKLCAEGIPSEVLNICDVRPFAKNTVRGISVSISDMEVAKYRTGEGIGWVVDRQALAQHLSDEASDNGAEVLTKTQARSVTKDIVNCGATQYEYSYVVFADGTNGVSRRLFNRFERMEVVALQTTVRNLCVEEPDILRFLIYEGLGYAWIFPRSSEEANVGAGYVNPRYSMPVLKHVLEKSELLRGGVASDIRGHTVPVGGIEGPLIRENWAVAGDAAGQVTPSLGEGNRFALAAGRFCGEAICRGDLRIYEKKFKPYRKEIEEQQMILNFVSSLEEGERQEMFRRFAQPVLSRVYNGRHGRERLRSLLNPLFWMLEPRRSLRVFPLLFRLGFKEFLS